MTDDQCSWLTQASILLGACHHLAQFIPGYRGVGLQRPDSYAPMLSNWMLGQTEAQHN